MTIRGVGLRGEISSSNIVNAGEINQRHNLHGGRVSQKANAGILENLKKIEKDIRGLDSKIRKDKAALKKHSSRMVWGERKLDAVVGSLPKLFGENKLLKYVHAKNYMNDLNRGIDLHASKIKERESIIKKDVEEINQLERQYMRLSASAGNG
ncbi:hypothetical protein [Mycoavidus sp. B2-EB]|uniref:hypothetical protein n=1 Tax=Mycoavidus sp. B2-EB TaxID=2651972 RepID=UPI001624E9EC|nr:hypothetical protein [Mycoavidus sp. B2-EB]BBO60344.1 hypothetical protein MPB2EB_1485 [Mycoavidus sp. B2-EB]